jgi:ribosome-binding protein aMBF1 (putative translation factor)
MQPPWPLLRGFYVPIYRRRSMRADAIRQALKEVDVGERVVAFRIHKGWSQQRLSEELGVNQPHVSQIENDHRRPSAFLVRKLAYALDVTAEELLLGELPTRSTDKTQAVA